MLERGRDERERQGECCREGGVSGRGRESVVDLEREGWE